MAINLDGAKLKRGDSYRFNVAISEGTFNQGDILEWVARKKIEDADPVIAKSSANGGVLLISTTEATVVILPSDTRPLTKGLTLYWEFQRRSADGTEVDTLILASGETVGTVEVEPDLLR